MQMPANNPQGLEAILQALAIGGQPIGNLAQIPAGINPAMQGSHLTSPSPSPTQEATMPVQGDQMQMIIDALLRNGLFNQQAQAG